MDQWYYSLNGNQQGPVSTAQLTQLLMTGQIPPNSQVWRDGMPNWLPANTVPELGVAQNAPVLGYGVGETVYQTAQTGFRYADFWIRFGGAFIDGLVLLIPNVIVRVIIQFGVTAVAGNGQDAALMGSALGFCAGLVPGWLYFAFMQSSASQATLGEMACGIKLVDEQGNRVTFGRATGRFFASQLSSLICLIGYFMMLWSDKKQTLHDQLAKTLVVYK